MTNEKRSCCLVAIFPVVFIVGIISGIFIHRASYDQMQLEAIAKRTGLKPSWDTIRNYYYCSILKYGNSKVEVLKSIREIGFYQSSETSPDMLSIYFDDPLVGSQLSDVLVVFDQNGNVSYKKRLLGWDSITILDCER